MAAYGEFFASAVSERRRKRGWTMQEVRDRGGPAVPTLVHAERGTLPDSVRPSTFRKFDAGLDWVPGSAHAAYHEGRDPVQTATDDHRPFVPGATRVQLDLDQLVPLLQAQRKLHAATITDLPAALAELDDAVTAIAGPFVTDILERNRGQQPHPLIEIAFGETLSAPVTPGDPRTEERLYRRWLIGRVEDLGETTRLKFEQRYESSRQKR